MQNLVVSSFFGTKVTREAYCDCEGEIKAKFNILSILVSRLFNMGAAQPVLRVQW